jgi:hypothetical protein
MMDLLIPRTEGSAITSNAWGAAPRLALDPSLSVLCPLCALGVSVFPIFS